MRRHPPSPQVHTVVPRTTVYHCHKSRVKVGVFGGQGAKKGGEGEGKGKGGEVVVPEKESLIHPSGLRWVSCGKGGGNG